jgi:hypothetical protein
MDINNIITVIVSNNGNNDGNNVTCKQSYVAYS